MTMVDRPLKIAKAPLDFEFWLVGFAVFISVIWNRFLPYTLLIAFIFWVIRRFSLGYFSVRTPIDWSVCLLLVMVLVSIFVTSLPEKTLPQFYRVASGIALCYAIVNWTNTRQRLRLVILLIVLAGIAISLIAPFSVTWSTSKLLFIPIGIYERFITIVSDTVHPNVMGGNLILILPLPISILIFGWKEIRWGERIIYGLAVLVMTLVILLTKSRGTWVALIAILMAITLFRWRFGWIIILASIGVATFVIFLLGFNDFLEVITANDALIGIEGRLDIWWRAILMIQDFPITGIGLGTFMDIADKFYPFFLFPPGKIIHAHNLFLQIAVDIGLPGLVAWVAIFISIWTMNWRNYRQGVVQKNRLDAGLGAGLMCCLLALIIHGLTDAVTWGFIRTAPMVWAIWGVSETLYYLQQYPSVYNRPISQGETQFQVEQGNSL
jgi:putative inorganic carbon (hco3(-)) transporter